MVCLPQAFTEKRRAREAVAATADDMCSTASAGAAAALPPVPAQDSGGKKRGRRDTNAKALPAAKRAGPATVGHGARSGSPAVRRWHRSPESRYCCDGSTSGG